MGPEVLLRWARRAAALLTLAPVASAWALTYLPIADDVLLQRASAVVVADVSLAGPVAGRELERTQYLLSVRETLKGSIGDAVTVEVPGAFDAGRSGALIVPGTPRFAQGERVLVFLDRRPDGSYAVTQLGLGGFHYRDAGNDPVLVRSVPAADVPGRYRDAMRFTQWLRRDAASRADYWTDADVATTPKYAFAEPNGRWFEFDSSQPVALFASEGGQRGLPGGGYAELQVAIAAWNDHADSNVRLAYGGVTAASAGLASADGVSTVLFNDPNDEIDGSFNCQQGGIGALTMWRGGALFPFKGGQYRAINEADIVVQDGVECLIGAAQRAGAAELFAHELGHALGLDHPCGDALLGRCEAGTLEDEALMRPTLHADGRGAALNDDDQAGASYLYPLNAQPPPGQPPPSAGNSGPTPARVEGGAAAGFALLWVALMLRRRRR